MFVIFYYSSAAWKFVEDHLGIDYGWEVVLTGNDNIELLLKLKSSIEIARIIAASAERELQ